MAIKGIFQSHQNVVGEKQNDFAGAVLSLFPTGQAQFMAISAGIPKESAQQVSFSWEEDAHISGRQACVSGALTATVVVADGSFYLPNQILMVQETGEYLFVENVVSNTLTVIRGFAGTTAVSITNAHNVQLIGNAFEEASTKPNAVHQQGAPRTNLVQIFRNAWSISGTAKAIKVTNGDRLARSKRQCAQYHSEDMERSFLWGRKSVSTRNGKQFRTTDGVLTQIEQYGGVVKTAATGGNAGELSMGDFEDFMRQIFQTNVKGQPNERISYAGDIALQQFGRMVRLDSTYDIAYNETEYGINIGTLITPFGKLKLMTHPMMSENPIWTKELYVLHPGGLKRRPLRETFNDDYDKSGARTNGVDADEGIMTTEGGIACGAAKTMGIYRNIAKGVKTT